MKKVVKQLFCKHNYLPYANIYGDFIHWMDGDRTVLLCPKCGKRKYIKEYINAPLSYNALMNYIWYAKWRGEKKAKELFAEDIFKDVEMYLRLFKKEE